MDGVPAYTIDIELTDTGQAIAEWLLGGRPKPTRQEILGERAQQFNRYLLQSAFALSQHGKVRVTLENGMVTRVQRTDA